MERVRDGKILPGWCIICGREGIVGSICSAECDRYPIDARNLDPRWLEPVRDAR